MSNRAGMAGWAVAVGLVLLALAAARRFLAPNAGPVAASRPVSAPSSPAPATRPQPAAAAHAGFLYGRVSTHDGAIFEGRLRWGGDEEAFWGDYFNGARERNPWLAHLPPERLVERRPVVIFGLEIARRERPIDFDRLFMARFGDLARIEAHGDEVRVTLKSGSVFELDRFEASDFDDGVRVWDRERGVVDLDSLRIRSIELLPTAQLVAAPDRLHGTVRTRRGEFTGFVQWNREACVGADELDGRTADGELSLRFDGLRSIARDARDSSRVTLLDGREMVLSGSRETGRGNRGLYVEDRRYGRVLVSWDAFERVDFSDFGSAGSGPAHGDFPPGRPLTGSVTTRGGRRLAGRLVFDLDESETIETLDAPIAGVTYTLPFGLVAAVVRSGGAEKGARFVSVTLHSGEELRLEPAGDLGEKNAGLLVFADGSQRAGYVPWAEVERIDLDRPPAFYPSLDADDASDGQSAKAVGMP